MKPALIELGCVRDMAVGRPSTRTAAIALQFGVPLFSTPTAVVEPNRIALGPGEIALIVGPSGSGKTTAIRQIEQQITGGCNVSRVLFPPDAAVVDRIAPWAPLSDALSILTCCGLGEARLWLRPFAALSDGEKFRARLARAVALPGRGSSRAPLLCDEFCSLLHRRVARAIAYGMRKTVSRNRMAVVVACSNEDLITDLQPNTVVRLGGAGQCTVLRRPVRATAPFTLRRRLVIEPGRKRDYEAFAAMHYRATDELGFVDKVFVMRDGVGGDLLGIVVYAHAPLELSLRNRATNGCLSRNPKRVNTALRTLRRLVVHPDVRGCGLGYYLVRKTLPLVGTEYVECLAAMGEFNPVFEKAGMKRIGQYELNKDRQNALKALGKLDVDPSSRDFPSLVCRRRRIRGIVSRVVYDWYSATTVNGQRRVARQSPRFLAQTFRGLIGSRPVYYLWHRKDSK